MKIGFIGGGNMGEAMISAILARNLAGASSIFVGETDEARRRHIAEHFGVMTVSDNLVAVEKRDVVVLAVKPQTLPAVMADLSGNLKPTQLVLSIVAGAKIATLRQGLKHDRIVRCMPNTPAQIGEGMTVWHATIEVTPEQRKQAASILGAMGKEIQVADEAFLDMATAVSGSGPAYFFLFVEALVEAAARIGMPRDIAGPLILQTMIGSAHLIEKSGKPPVELRRMVTSPGGTTAAAVASFEAGKFRELVAQAVAAAYARAQELGK